LTFRTPGRTCRRATHGQVRGASRCARSRSTGPCSRRTNRTYSVRTVSTPSRRRLRRRTPGCGRRFAPSSPGSTTPRRLVIVEESGTLNVKGQADGRGVNGAAASLRDRASSTLDTAPVGLGGRRSGSRLIVAPGPRGAHALRHAHHPGTGRGRQQPQKPQSRIVRGQSANQVRWKHWGKRRLASQRVVGSSPTWRTNVISQEIGNP
jgi:hypothetical protein